MADLALYRKYRPQDFDAVIGQDHVVRVLSAAVANGAVAHAYLFSGTRGTGKTSVARIFAKALGTSAEDVTELDAASNRGIDDIRELREGVHTLPFNSPYKVYIVDEAHMLTKEAFNALLKTLEEPPAHAIFILATTEAEKLPETIVSRCQTYRFNTPSETVLAKAVAETAKAEGYEIRPETAETIALLGDGSFRDALGILQKVVSVSKDGVIDPEEVSLVTGAPTGEQVNAFLGALVEGRGADALDAVRAAEAAHLSAPFFLKLALRKLRSILLCRIAPERQKALLEEYGEADRAFVAAMAGKRSPVLLSSSVTAFLEAEESAGRISMPWLAVEVLAMRLAVEKAG